MITPPKIYDFPQELPCHAGYPCELTYIHTQASFSSGWRWS